MHDPFPSGSMGRRAGFSLDPSLVSAETSLPSFFLPCASCFLSVWGWEHASHPGFFAPREPLCWVTLAAAGGGRASCWPGALANLRCSSLKGGRCLFCLMKTTCCSRRHKTRGVRIPGVSLMLLFLYCETLGKSFTCFCLFCSGGGRSLV